ncbi:MAG: sulfatase [Bryobacteraceae bacterium]
MSTRRHFLAQAAGGAAAAFAQTPRRPRNILLLIADDLGLHTGAYGDSTALTPNLDRLAREGVRFTNAFCTTPSCSASRSVMLSGLHNHANGHFGHAHSVHNFSYLPSIRPLPAVLKQSGYRSGVIGKLHVNPVSSFQWDLDSQGQNRDVLSMAERARDFVRASGDRPWYLHVGYGDPHRLGKGFGNGDYRGVKRNRFDPAKVAAPSFLPDNAATRTEVAEYYEASNRLDQGVGFMLDVLRETGQLDNTLILFLSDNGMPFPNAKTNLYDAGARMPLIVRSPEQRNRGLVNNALVSWVDLFPTCAAWAGANLPDYPLHGRNFLPILERENPSGWDRVFFSHTFHEVTMYYPIRGIRTQRYKYLRNLFPELEFPHASDLWESGTWQSLLESGERAAVGRRPVPLYLHRHAEELYDVASDPDELSNLANSAEHQGVLREMRATVERWRKETGDPWLINDNYKRG